FVDDRPAGLGALEPRVARRHGAAGEAQLEPALTGRPAPRGALGAAADRDRIQPRELVAAAPREQPIAVQHHEQVRPGGRGGAALSRVVVLGAGGRADHARPLWPRFGSFRSGRRRFAGWTTGGMMALGP